MVQETPRVADRGARAEVKVQGCSCLVVREDPHALALSKDAGNGSGVPMFEDKDGNAVSPTG